VRLPYFPGCTLYTRARGLDHSTRAALAALGIELEELPNWTCCGTVFPLAQDNYIGMVAAARILASAARYNGRLVTVCSFCYHVLKRVNHSIKNNAEARRKLNDYLEQDYGGETVPVHPLEILKHDVGWEALRARARGRLKGLKVACYYGCLLVRPAMEMAFDDPENPTIMEEFAAALGAEPVSFPYRTACCGSYQVLHAYDVVASRGRDILAGAAAHGAQALITSCPLCQFNLDWLQGRGEGTVSPVLPVLYFTQLLGTALELPAEGLGFESHYVDPRPLLLGN